jgi:glutamate 5-kinase
VRKTGGGEQACRPPRAQAIDALVTARSELQQSRRIVIKVGSKALAADGELQQKFAAELAALSSPKRGFVLVTSGAIAFGMSKLGYRTRPKETGKLQAAAAAGQSVLMRRWDEAFSAVGLTVAQVLLTHDDLADRERVNNARDAFAALLEAGAIPIVNENDTVSTAEIRLDNDQLAAMVSPLVSADLLILLTDVEGVLDKNGKRIPMMNDDAELGTVVQAGERLGSGGIQSKLDAANKVCHSGASVVIAAASRANVIRDIVSGADVGTLVPRRSPLKARQHWIAYTLRPRGTVLVDSGAEKALRGGKSSLLPVGVLGVRGEFNVGDAVRLVGASGGEIGRGLTRLGALDVSRAAGKQLPELQLAFGGDAKELVVVHKDDLVLS